MSPRGSQGVSLGDPSGMLRDPREGLPRGSQGASRPMGLKDPGPGAQGLKDPGPGALGLKDPGPGSLGLKDPGPGAFL